MSFAASPLRRLRRSPGLSFAVVATLALGVGVATALEVYLAAFLRPMMPARHPDRLVQVHFGTREDPTALSSLAEFRAIAASGLFDEVSANRVAGATVTAGGEAQFAWGQGVTPSFFSIFAARPAIGRLLTASDETAPDLSPVVVSHRLWRGLLHADPAAIGRPIELNGTPYTVVGVTHRGFQGVGFAAEWFVPVREIDRLTGLARLDDPGAKFLFVWGVLPHGTGPASVEGALGGVAHGLDAASPLAEGETRIPKLELATLFGASYEEDPYYLAARILTVAAILFLLLGAANVSGLLLARATARDHEWAVRQAMGAGPWRLATALLVELVPVAVLGLAGAAAVATALLRWIEGAIVVTVGGIGSTWTVDEPSFLHLDGAAATFAVAATALALGIATAAPLLRVLRRSPARALRSGETRAGTERRVLAPRRLLVAFEMALAVVLLVGGGLLARTLGAYAAADPGFDTRGLALAAVFVPPAASGADSSADFFRDLLVRVREIPGVDGATLASVGPNSGWSRSARAARVEEPEGGLRADYNIVAPGYHGALGVPILAGRALAPRDRADAAPVVVVSRALAEQLWGSPTAALGRRLRVDVPARSGEPGPDFEVVGVAADAGVTSPAEPARPWIFFAYGQRTAARMQLVVRSGLPLAELEPRLRGAVAATRSDASLIDLVSAPEQLHRALQAPRMNAQVAGGLALAGLATALVGLAALQAFTVRLKRRDLAVRMALGATAERVSREVLGESMRLVLAGVAVGLAASLAVTRLLRSVLFGVAPLDPVSFVGVPLLLAATAILAAWLPARRAARIDPARNLRAL